MLVNLPTGKTMEMTLDQYLSLEDNDFQELIAMGYGEHINDPFHGSILHSSPGIKDEIDDSPDLGVSPPFLKISDLDIEQEEE